VTIDALQALGDFVRPGHIPDRDSVDIKLLVTELHCASDYDYDNDNRSAVAGLTTRTLPNNGFTGVGIGIGILKAVCSHVDQVHSLWLKDLKPCFEFGMNRVDTDYDCDTDADIYRPLMLLLLYGIKYG
jgi:hypothetical protein